MPHRSKAITFDLDPASLTSLQEAMPEWKIEPVNGATAGSLTHNWNHGAAALLVVEAGEYVAETLSPCRFLVFCNVVATDSRDDQSRTSEQPGTRQNQIRGGNT